MAGRPSPRRCTPACAHVRAPCAHARAPCAHARAPCAHARVPSVVRSRKGARIDHAARRRGRFSCSRAVSSQCVHRNQCSGAEQQHEPGSRVEIEEAIEGDRRDERRDHHEPASHAWSRCNAGAGAHPFGAIGLFAITRAGRARFPYAGPSHRADLLSVLTRSMDGAYASVAASTGATTWVGRARSRRFWGVTSESS
jgi:hypothetical protein